MSMQPGVQNYGDIDPAIGLASSVTQDPMTPVEYGRTAAGSKYTLTASSGADIPDQTPAPPVP